MTARPLHLVREPEAELADLFAREDELQRELAEVRKAQAWERDRYAAKHGLRMNPCMARLRVVLR